MQVLKSICVNCRGVFNQNHMLPGGRICSLRCLETVTAKILIRNKRLNPDLPLNEKFPKLTKIQKKRTEPRSKCKICPKEVDPNCSVRPYCSRACARKEGAFGNRKNKSSLKKKILDTKSSKKRHSFNFIDLWSDENKKKWQILRYQVLREQGKSCGLCGSIKKPMHVDHVKPKSKYPELAFEITNLQVLCEDCNIGKSNLYEDDWRTRDVRCRE